MKTGASSAEIDELLPLGSPDGRGLVAGRVQIGLRELGPEPGRLQFLQLAGPGLRVGGLGVEPLGHGRLPLAELLCCRILLVRAGVRHQVGPQALKI